MRSAASATIAIMWLLASHAESAVAQPAGDGLRIALGGKARMVVEDAVRGASRRLAVPECQLLLEEFRDSAGRPLSARLVSAGQTVIYYITTVHFVDGDGTAQCQRDDAIAAFTEPGSRVIFVCARGFAERFARRTAGGEILVIHELLHSLGLGENPPTPAQITARVWDRCRVEP
jgi:hypothetical protein